VLASRGATIVRLPLPLLNVIAADGGIVGHALTHYSLGGW
jgi:hypothetical protein